MSPERICLLSCSNLGSYLTHLAYRCCNLFASTCLCFASQNVMNEFDLGSTGGMVHHLELVMLRRRGLFESRTFSSLVLVFLFILLLSCSCSCSCLLSLLLLFALWATCANLVAETCLRVCASQTVMDEFDLGPNGGMVYCLEYLEKNVDWLMERLEGLNKKYLIFDFPGQVWMCAYVRVRFFLFLFAENTCFLRDTHAPSREQAATPAVPAVLRCARYRRCWGTSHSG